MYIFYVILYKIVLDISYIVVSRIDSDIVIVFNALNIRMLISYILAFILTLPMAKRQNNNAFIDIFLNIELIIMIIPMLSVYAFTSQNHTLLMYPITVYFIQILLSRWFYSQSINVCSNQYFYILLHILLYIILIIGCYATIKYARMPSLDAFNLNNTYIIRDNANSMPFWTGYFTTWATKIVMPYLFCYSLIKHKYFMTIFICALQLLFYMIYAHKVILFTLPFVLFIYIIIKTKKPIIYFMKNLTFGLIISIGAYLIGFSRPIIILADRFLLIPAQIKFAYYSFFSVNEKVHFADGLIGKILGIQSPYDYTIPQQISVYLYNASVPFNANTGYIADSFANGGVIGLMIISIFLIMFVYSINCVSQNVDKRITVPLMVLLFMTLNDGAFLTMCLTDGGLLLFLIFLSLNRKTLNVRK